ncbi:MAG: hypothetical protein FD131_2264 [Rhodocyclaceae bacterium]|nr:MAG: hypothetical protein FD131_2264 [Rhodocyclaceae bacterium]
MESLTTVVVAALGVLGAVSVSELTKKATSDAYDSLKKLLAKKADPLNPLLVAIQSLERSPNSAARIAVLDEEASAPTSLIDQEVLGAIQNLQTVLRTQAGTSTVSNLAIGTNIAQASNGATASVVNADKEK